MNGEFCQANNRRDSRTKTLKTEALAAEVMNSILSRLRVGLLTSTGALIEALAILQVALRMISSLPQNIVVRLVDRIAQGVRERLETIIVADDEARCKWEIIDLILAIIVGTVRYGLLTAPEGLDAINEIECREWLRLNGASERSLNSAFMRGLYDLAIAYENGDRNRPGLAAGEALRGSLRLFFSYRGAFFWKMRAGMGDIVFAPFYQVLVRRGVEFQFFHRLTNVKLSPLQALRPGERPYVEALEFDVQAKVRSQRGYQPLIEANGVPCWPSIPDYKQLQNGRTFEADGWEFELHWDRRRVGSKTLRVTRDFDFVVLGVSIGEIPFVCKEIIARDARWRAMVDNVKTVATQAFQLWLGEELEQLGWVGGPVTLAGFSQPFDTWSDMTHVVPAESWRNPPKSVAYFCSVLPDTPAISGREADAYSQMRRNAGGAAMPFIF